jgi:hypothetical protein
MVVRWLSRWSYRAKLETDVAEGRAALVHHPSCDWSELTTERPSCQWQGVNASSEPPEMERSMVYSRSFLGTEDRSQWMFIPYTTCGLR